MENYWDAKRLVREYVKISTKLPRYKKGNFEDIPWDNQIRIKRLAAVISAYNGAPHNADDPRTVLRELPNAVNCEDFFEHSTMSKENVLKLKELFMPCLGDGFLSYDPVWEFMEKSSWERAMTFLALFPFRVKAEGLLSSFDGYMCLPGGGVMAYQTIKNLYFDSIQHNNDILDEMIALLLGDKFTASFTEEELKEKYNYPKETDSELMDRETDNF